MKHCSEWDFIFCVEAQFLTFHFIAFWMNW